MNSKELNIDVIGALRALKSSDGTVPSPYFVPTKVLISEDEILGLKNIIFIYFNKEPEVIKEIGNIKIFLGKISGKIQRIETDQEINKTFETIRNEKLSLGFIVDHIFKTYINPAPN
jgi:hypothetical protein